MLVMPRRIAAFALVALLALPAAACDKCGNWFGRTGCGQQGQGIR
jgi:hypothetical protein